MRRRALLLTLAGSSLAGCLGPDALVGGSTETRPSPDTRRAPPEPLSCPTPTETGEVGMPPWPAFPESLTRESAVEYATDFERVYRIRKTASDSPNYYLAIDVRVTDVTEVTRTDDGWVVSFWVNGPATRHRPDPESTETRHGDPPMYGVGYFVGTETTLRTQSLDPVDPRDAGVESAVVTCTPE